MQDTRLQVCTCAFSLVALRGLSLFCSFEKAGGSEIAKLRAENAKLKAALASCEAERDTVKKSLDDMIDIMDK